MKSRKLNRWMLKAGGASDEAKHIAREVLFNSVKGGYRVEIET